MIITNVSNKEEALKNLMLIKTDFKVFLRLVWSFLKLPEPSLVQLEIADFLQSGDDRRMIQAYRGVGKTFITGSYVCWKLFNDPNENFIIVSSNSTTAEEISMFIKNILTNMPLLKHLDPNKSNRNSVMKFDVACRTVINKSPSVKIAGIGGSIVGSRATEIIADDVEVSNNSRTITMRETIRNSTKEFTNIIVKGGRITYLGTPQTEDSIYTKLGENYNIQIWPARYPMLDKVLSYGSKLFKRIRDEVLKDNSLQWRPTNTEQHDEKDLLKRELDSGKSNFMLQYMLDTTLTDAERYPLKINEVMVMDLDIDIGPASLCYGTGREQQIENIIPDNAFTGQRLYKPLYIDKNFIPYNGSVLTIDPSGRGSDETGYCVAKVINGFVFILDCDSVEGGYSDTTLMKLAMIAKKYKVNEVILESNYGDGIYTKMLSEVFNKLYPCHIGEVWNSKQKELRIIEHLEPLFNRHKIVFDSNIFIKDNKVEKQEYSLIYQISRITKDRNSLKHDDKLDALSMAVQYWVDSLGIDEKKAIELLEESKLEEELKNFINGYNNVKKNTNYNAIGKN